MDTKHTKLLSLLFLSLASGLSAAQAQLLDALQLVELLQQREVQSPPLPPIPRHMTPEQQARRWFHDHEGEIQLFINQHFNAAGAEAFNEQILRQRHAQLTLHSDEDLEDFAQQIVGRHAGGDVVAAEPVLPDNLSKQTLMQLINRAITERADQLAENMPQQISGMSSDASPSSAESDEDDDEFVGVPEMFGGHQN